MARQSPKRFPGWVRHSGVGIEFAGAVAGFALLGWWLDSRWESGPWGLLIGVALGLIGGTYNLVRESIAAFKATGNNEDEEKTNDRP